MERRLAITYAVSVTATLCTACVAVATVSGGLFVQAAPSMKAGVKQVENIDDYIVVHSETTAPPTVTSVARAYIVAPATTTASTEAPTTTEAPAPVIAAAPVAAAPAAAETQFNESEAPEEVEAPGPATHEHTRRSSDDHTWGDGSGSDTNHHSDDEHERDDGEHD